MSDNYWMVNHEPKNIEISVIDNPDNWYPNSPGYQSTDTSKAAAEEVKDSGRDKSLQKQIMALLGNLPFGITADDAAAYLNESVLSLRPRFRELALAGKIKDSGKRGRTAFNKASIIWVTM